MTRKGHKFLSSFQRSWQVKVTNLCQGKARSLVNLFVKSHGKERLHIDFKESFESHGNFRSQVNSTLMSWQVKNIC